MNSQLSALWSARSIAVIGASGRAGAPGRLPIEFLQRYGYRGRILPVRPDGATVLDLPSFKAVQECPPPVELAMILVSADRVGQAIDDCIKAAVPVAIVCSSGFAETGETGAALQDEIVATAQAGGVRLLGPNCIGTVGVHNRQVTSFSPLFAGAKTELVSGSLAFVSQSGALGYGAVSLAFERGLGLGWVVNTGNEADVNAPEVMAALTAEPGCGGLLAYVETLDDIKHLREVVDSGLPVAVLKAGRSDAGQRAAASHTGALAAGDRLVDAALRQLRMVRVDDVEGLLDVGDAFAQPRRTAGPRVAVVTTSGGSGILAADAVDAAGLQLSTFSPQTRAALEEIVPAYGATANPVDVTATVMSNAQLFDRTLDAIVDDDGVDMVVACFCVLTGNDVDEVVASLSRAAKRSGKPVLAARTGADHLAPAAAAQLRSEGIAAYPTPARAVRAAAALHQISRRPTSPQADPAGPVEPPPPGVGEHELKELLAEAGLPIPRGRSIRDRADAEPAVRELGGRAVLKAVVPGLVHKSEAGGVAIDVSADSAIATFDRLARLGGQVLAEEMVTGSVEALVGVAGSPLGPVLALGPGGILTELLDDVALRLLPVDRLDIQEMIDQTRLTALLSGVRGAAAADRAALVEMVLTVSQAIARWPAGFELDLNPVAVWPDGVCILDAAYVSPEVR